MYICGQELHSQTPCDKRFLYSSINEVYSGSQEGKFGSRTHVPKNFSCCSLLLQIGTITATVRDSHHSNDLPGLQGGLNDRLLHFFVYDRSLAEACTVITNSTLIQRNFWYIISL